MRAQDLSKRAQPIPTFLRTGLSALFSVALITAASLSWADDDDDDEDEIPFEEAHIFFELNNTDGDLGIHALIDGEPWKKLKIEGPDERKYLDIKVRSRLRQQGLTEIFFESAEPPFESDDPEEVTLTPEEFFARFPEGIYEVEGETLEGNELESETEVTHVMPAPPVVTLTNGVVAVAAAENCDADLPALSAPITISWQPVMMSHPDLGTPGVMIDVVNYEVVVEIDETPFRNSIILPPDTTSFDVPSEIVTLSSLNDGEVKFEVLVREASFNQTAVESCFCVDECPEDEE